LPDSFDVDLLKRVYGYQFDLEKVKTVDEISAFSGSTIFISQQADVKHIKSTQNIDFFMKFSMSEEERRSL